VSAALPQSRLQELEAEIKHSEKEGPLAQRLAELNRQMEAKSKQIKDLETLKGAPKSAQGDSSSQASPASSQPKLDVATLRTDLATLQKERDQANGQLQARLNKLRDQLWNIRKPGLPAGMPGAYAVQDGKPIDAYVQVRGDIDQHHLADQFRRNQIRVVPTLSLDWTALEAARRDPVIVEADRLRYIPMAYKDEWKRAQTGSVESLQRLFDKEVELVRELHRSGVELLAGTDVVKPFFVPGPSLHDELSLLVKAGLSPMEALEAATRNPARFLGLKDVGTIEPGMVADLVLLDANPLQNIENTQRIATVVAAGRLIEKRELQIMLGDIQQTAAQWTGTPTGR